jgi:hypothetical protein
MYLDYHLSKLALLGLQLQQGSMNINIHPLKTAAAAQAAVHSRLECVMRSCNL